MDPIAELEDQVRSLDQAEGPQVPLDAPPQPRWAIGAPHHLIEYEGGIRASAHCIVHPSAHIGARCTIWHYAQVCAGAVLLEDVLIGSSVWVGPSARIGNRVRIQDKCHITPGIFIGDDVFIGPMVVTMDDRHPRVGNTHYRKEPCVIRRGAAIGAGVVILPGVEIGEGALIGAGAVVARDVPAGAIVRGEPARATGSVE